MRELGRVIRAYASDRQHTWWRIVSRAEDVINDTVHSSTGHTPNEIHYNVETHWHVCDELRPMPTQQDEEDRLERIQQAKDRLASQARKRKVQADKHEVASRLQPGDGVMVKLHRRSDANRRLTRKIHLVYDGPYRVAQEVRENAYLIESLDGHPKGVYNSRQLRPYRRPILREDQDNSDGESNNSHSENEDSHQEDDDSTNEDINSQREDSEDFDSQEDELEVCVITMHELTSSEEDDADSDCDWTLLTQTAEEYDERFNTINININEDLNKEQHNSAEKQCKTNQLSSTSTMKTTEENKNEQLIETKIKIENAEEQLEDAEEQNYQPITSQEDIKYEVKIEITEKNTSRQINIVSNAEEQSKPIKEEIGENAEENAEKRDKLPKEEKLSQSDEDNIEERITEIEKEISEKLSAIKKEEVGEPFDKKNDSFIHIKRVRTYLRSGSENSSNDPGNQDDLKHKNKKLKSNNKNKEDTYQRSENEEEDFSEDPEDKDDYKKWKRLKDYYKDSSDESEDEEKEYNRWKRRKKQVMEIIKKNNNYRAEDCREEGAVERENSKPANVANPVTKVKSLLAERFHLASCSQLTDSETENEEKDNNLENKETENRDDQLESPDEIMLSESSMSEGEEREIANCFNQIQEIINRRFNGDNVNNDSQQRENANEHPEDNDSSDGHSQNDENDNNQPEENENYDSEGEKTIHSSRGSTRSFNRTLEEELFMDMQDPSEIVFSEQERLNIISYNIKFRSNPGHWIREPINGELEVAASDGCETALTRVRDTLRDERHNGRFDRAAVVNGHSRARVHRAQKNYIDIRKVPQNEKMSREKRRLERWEDNLQ
ncbi:trichohyalin-like, partial [Temnothorax curvispinosus]|uniref:Trichohyalin-like n=1 Tax=Temnothorax curvispinosus TaxID=300111 RepID=A0A6J1QTQ2_9HYME